MQYRIVYPLLKHARHCSSIFYEGYIFLGLLVKMVFQRFPLTARFGTSSSLFRHQRKQRCTALKSTAAAEAAAEDSKPLKPEFLYINSSPVFTDPRQGLLLPIHFIRVSDPH
jgi:hypothetical protein